MCYINPPHVVFIPWSLTSWDPMVPQEATDEQRHGTSWKKDPHSAPFLCNRWVWRALSIHKLTDLLSYFVSDFWCSSLISSKLVCVLKPFRSLFIQIAAKPDSQTVAMSTSSLRRQVKNIVHNYSEAEIKVGSPLLTWLFNTHAVLCLWFKSHPCIVQHAWLIAAVNKVIFIPTPTHLPLS